MKTRHIVLVTLLIFLLAACGPQETPLPTPDIGAIIVNASDNAALMFAHMNAEAFAKTQSTGFILQTTGSYWSLFLIASGAYVTALVIIHLLVPDYQPAVVDAPKLTTLKK